MKKINVVILSIFLVAFTAVATFFVSNIMQLDTGDKVVISKSALQSFQETVDKYKEVEELSDYIKTNYYLDVTE